MTPRHSRQAAGGVGANPICCHIDHENPPPFRSFHRGVPRETRLLADETRRDPGQNHRCAKVKTPVHRPAGRPRQARRRPSPGPARGRLRPPRRPSPAAPRGPNACPERAEYPQRGESPARPCSRRSPRRNRGRGGKHNRGAVALAELERIAGAKRARAPRRKQLPNTGLKSNRALACTGRCGSRCEDELV